MPAIPKEHWTKVTDLARENAKQVAEIATFKAECERLTASLAAAGRNFTRVGNALEQSQDALAAAKEELASAQLEVLSLKEWFDKSVNETAAAKAEARELACKFNTCSVQCEHDVCALVRRILADERGEK